jgi:DegV family protein with EDD domain
MVDTGCDLPREYIDKHGLAVIPIPFQIDGTWHNQGGWQEISGGDFYRALRDGGRAGTTQINPETFTEVFSDYAGRGEALLLITLSSGPSGACQGSVVALNDVKESNPDCEIFTVDSLNAAPGIGLVTALAIKKRAEGLSAAETAGWLNERKNSCFSLFTVDNLMFLHRGGRVSRLSAVAGSIIGVKPVLNISPNGELKLKDKARGRKGSLEMLVNQMKRSVNPDRKSLDTVLIGHGDCEGDALIVEELVRAAYDVKELIIVTIGPVIGAHSGPGTIALFFESDITRSEYEAKFYKK